MSQQKCILKNCAAMCRPLLHQMRPWTDGGVHRDLAATKLLVNGHCDASWWSCVLHCRSILRAAALLAITGALSAPAAHAVGVRAAKGKQAAGKGGLFNPAGRTEELASAGSKRKQEV